MFSTLAVARKTIVDCNRMSWRCFRDSLGAPATRSQSRSREAIAAPPRNQPKNRIDDIMHFKETSFLFIAVETVFCFTIWCMREGNPDAKCLCCAKKFFSHSKRNQQMIYEFEFCAQKHSRGLVRFNLIPFLWFLRFLLNLARLYQCLRSTSLENPKWLLLCNQLMSWINDYDCYCLLKAERIRP